MKAVESNWQETGENRMEHTAVKGLSADLYQAGSLVRSLAGHDKECYYIILEERAEYVILSDGKRRMLDYPKKKKKKHVQPIRQRDEIFWKRLSTYPAAANQEIQRFLRNYIKNECCLGATKGEHLPKDQ